MKVEITLPNIEGIVDTFDIAINSVNFPIYYIVDETTRKFVFIATINAKKLLHVIDDVIKFLGITVNRMIFNDEELQKILELE